jgi:hypothetical protein
MQKYLPKADFIKFCQILRDYGEKHHQIYKLGVDLISFSDDLYFCINAPMELIYGKKNYELVTDWVYKSWDGKIYGKNMELENNLDSAEKLWEYVETLDKK